MGKRSISFKKGMEKLLSLTPGEIRELAESLVLQDESSALDNSVVLNLEYGYPRAAQAKRGQDCKLGKLACPEAGVADGEDLEYAEGMPGILLTHYRTREFKGESTQGAECSAPSISMNKDGKLMSLGLAGFRHGACDRCPRNTFEEGIDSALKCMSLNRFVLLTVYPDSEGNYKPVLMQFKGDGTRSTPLKNALTKIIGELGGKVYGNLVKVDTLQKDGTYTNDKGKPESYTTWLYTFEKVQGGSLKPELRAPLIELKEKLLSYYYDQHQMRTQLFSADTSVKKPDLLDAPAEGTKQIETTGEVVEAEVITGAKKDDGFSL